MKRFLRLISVSMAMLMIMLTFQFSGAAKIYAKSSPKKLTILFSHDMHDHLLPFNLLQNGQASEVGGYARLQSAINQAKQKDPDLLLVDGGDYSMGTLFETIYSSDSPELRILGQLGYDVVTFGNHEFECKPEGLTGSLNAAKKSGDKLPQIVSSNITFPKDKNGNMTQSLKDLKQAMNNYGVKDYTIVNKNGVKIGIFGLMGKDAASCAPLAEVKFGDIVDSAKRVAKILKEKEKVDLIVCLSHSGTDPDKSKSEDEILAKKVPDINVIVSGHTHTKLSKPIIAGKTIIGSCGEYGENLGEISITQNSDKSWNLSSYRLQPINSSLPEDPGISNTINKFKNIVQQKYLNNFGLEFDDVLANTDFNFVATTDIGKKHGEDSLGDLITDSYVYAVKKAEGNDYYPITMAIVPVGTIRGSFVKGNITTADAFNISPLGLGPDNVSGYPLISIYLTGKELKTACEVDASISPLMPSAQLYMSGVNFKFNPNRLIFNKVTDVKRQDEDGSFEKLDDKKLYRVVVGLYSAQMLSVVGKKSFGLLSIVPKNKDGDPITDYEDQVITDKINGHKVELKEWLAIAEYLQSFDRKGYISQVPDYYKALHNRKIVDNNHSLSAIFSDPDSIAVGVYCIAAGLIILIIFIIFKVATRKKRRAKRLSNRESKYYSPYR